MLEAIARVCVRHLREGGYITEEEAAPLLAEYSEQLKAAGERHDFLAFLAERQAQKHSLTFEGEVARMQKVLRARMNERVHYWTFGPLPGRPNSLYDRHPMMRKVCAALACPSVLLGDAGMVHTASINPVAALVAGAWISHEMQQEAEAEKPFVFSYLVDLPAWNSLLQRQFAA